MLLPLLGWVPAGLPEVGEDYLCQRNYLTPEAGAQVLNEALNEFSDTESWDAYVAHAKKRMLQGMSLENMPERTPLQVVRHSKRVYDGYSVENVAIESGAGLWLTGNLYMPTQVKPPYAAVLHPHGHSVGTDGKDGWSAHGRFKADVQYRAATLARMGAVSLTTDMVGYGDNPSYSDHTVHRDSSTMALQLWNNIRAIDFLQGLEEVDAERIGVTAHSGGATQGFLLAALDERVAVQVSVCMVSAHFFGGCPCESGVPIHRSEDHFISNAMIAAMMSPRPLMLVSVGGDWTLNTPEVEYPFVRGVYRRAGVEERVENVHLADEEHNYGASKRAALYPFMAKWLGLNNEWDESHVTIEEPEMMRVAGEPVRVVDLRCEGLVTPVGMDVNRPRLSWRLEGERRGIGQSAWEMRVASSVEILDTGKGDLWESGKVSGSDSWNVYRNTPLSNHERVYWQVRVWDERGQRSAWSEPSHWIMGMPDRHGWDAEWIAHPEWLEFERAQLGYRSEAASAMDTPKWIELDLGRDYAVDAVVLHALRHSVAERLGFPVHFKVEVSTSAQPESRRVLMDTTDEPLNIWFPQHRIEGDGAMGRFVRITVPVLRELNGEICLAFSQIEVLSGGENVALGSRVTASDSIEDDVWSVSAVVDGLGLAGSNPVVHNTVEARREFNLRAAPKRALIHIAGLGGYILEINGRRVGADVLKPGWTDVDKTVLYDSYDVTQLLREGSNAIGVRLASGMYSVSEPGDRYTKFVNRFRPLTLRATLWIEYEDGETETIGSDEDWQVRKGAVTYSHVFGGEDYDARRLEKGWSEPGLSASAEWQAAVVTEGPRGWLRGITGAASPIVHHDVLQPVATDHIRAGLQVYDLGQNAALMIRLQAKGAAGSRIRVTPAELLREDGTVDRSSVAHRNRPAYWQFTLAGTGETEEWVPDYFYHGARYLQVERFAAEGTERLPEVVSIEGLVTHSAAEPVGDFATSSELYNQTRELVRWAQRSNMVSVLTDCPHRERLGWLEQYNLNGPSLRHEFDLSQLFLKTFRDMMDAQTDAGLVPNIAPEYIVFEGAFRDSPEWGSSIVLAVWQQYLFTGDKDLLTRYYNPMQAYLEYLASKADGWILDHGLGDWYDLGPEHPGFSQLTPRALTATATFYQCVVIVRDIAAMRGRLGEATAYAEWAEEICKAFNEKFLDRESGIYATGSQTSQAMPLVTGLVPDELRGKVLDRLIQEIAGNGYALTSGDVGHRYLLLALAQGGRSDMIHAMHHQRERPGYGWQLDQGATSLSEAWDANRRASQNHFMLGHIIEWFYQYLAGIAPDAEEPGFKHVIIAPQPVGDLRFAEASHRSRYGLVKVRWERVENVFRLRIMVPANSHATVYVPSESAEGVLENGKAAEMSEGVEFVKYEDGRAVYKVGSGAYVFETGEGL